jgi:hypothetical protein
MLMSCSPANASPATMLWFSQGGAADRIVIGDLVIVAAGPNDAQFRWQMD